MFVLCPACIHLERRRAVLVMGGSITFSGVQTLLTQDLEILLFDCIENTFVRCTG